MSIKQYKKNEVMYKLRRIYTYHRKKLREIQAFYEKKSYSEMKSNYDTWKRKLVEAEKTVKEFLNNSAEHSAYKTPYPEMWREIHQLEKNTDSKVQKIIKSTDHKIFIACIEELYDDDVKRAQPKLE